ncbi:5-formyltetrahydrofolate cyclo-ligase [Lysinibacillus endophyticus]|uniref:5-formyltetrahydrofolate cyclo-ligase n=1 Tax=Ureibacillus endophyticus TaxID=1978490 RepID=UPI0020A0337E|nr:5-formyltetrahydrofolate cyclo-ligase [Lysinibacillus endophyticus]MCP1145229.1 5-formyltetrahydrofolate cyclo-ligase [Lysinibacillus endophyticus]
MSNDLYMRSSLVIREKLLKEPSIIEGNTIAITISNNREVDTIGIIESLWKADKNVVVPKCNSKNRTMQFYKIENFNQLEIVYMDLREPIPDLTELVSAEQINCMIVPGIVFDKSGYRIGYGGGYYDRYLERFEGQLISLAFHFQVVESVPKDSHDIPVNVIITDQDRIDCNIYRKR